MRIFLQTVLAASIFPCICVVPFSLTCPKCDVLSYILQQEILPPGNAVRLQTSSKMFARKRELGQGQHERERMRTDDPGRWQARQVQNKELRTKQRMPA